MNHIFIKPNIYKRQALFVFSALILLSSARLSFAHDNNIVHPGLTHEGIYLANIPEITDRGFFDINTNQQCSFIDEGSVKEDRLFNAASSGWNTNIWGTNTCAVPIASWVNHSYNPITGDGWWDMGGIDTLTYVTSDSIWDDAVWNRTYGDQDDAYFGLGRVSHLLEDMTSPAHVHGDVHGFGGDDDFEAWGTDHFASYDFSTMGLTPYIPTGMVTLPNDEQVNAESIQGILHSLAMFTYSLSAFSGHLNEIAGDQPDSELSRMFPTLHYYDGGILEDSYWEIDDIGRFETTLSDQWWACDSDYTEDNGGPGGVRQIIGNFYIENSAGDSGTLTPAVFEKTGVYVANPNTKTLLEIYGDVLYPQTVSYVAGLMNVFTNTEVISSRPRVICVIPDNGAPMVARNVDISISFSKAMNSTSFTSSTIQVVGSSSGSHQCGFIYESGTNTLKINPYVDFSANETIILPKNWAHN